MKCSIVQLLFLFPNRKKSVYIYRVYVNISKTPVNTRQQCVISIFKTLSKFISACFMTQNASKITLYKNLGHRF